MSESRIEMSPGVLSKRQVERLFESQAITSLSNHAFGKPDIDGSAFDLRITREAWHVTAGQRPATRELERLLASASKFDPKSDSAGEYFLFDNKQIYLVKLDTYLQLPRNINGRATGKSSIGRLDVITRLLTKPSREYDVVDTGYGGELYLLVSPQTFSIEIRPGESLNQLRLFSGPPHASVITRDIIGEFGTPFWHVAQQQGSKRDYEPWDNLLNKLNESRVSDPTLFDLTVDLADPDYRYIFKANHEVSCPIDLRKGEKSHAPSDYFTKIQIEDTGPASSVILEQGSFYIMKSKERLHIPCDVAVEITAISERIGDIRIHYAGFAHPGFGQYKHRVKRGTPLIFEVRATDMPTRLYEGSLLAKVQLFRMSTKTIKAKSAYDRQELKLSNVFKDWTEYQS